MRICFGAGNRRARRFSAAIDGAEMSKPFIPDHSVHVSEFIQEELEARGWTRQEVYDRLGYDASDCLAFELIMDVKDKNILLDEKLSKGLGYVFTVDPDLFVRLHEAWRNHPSTPESSSEAVTQEPKP